MRHLVTTSILAIGLATGAAASPAISFERAAPAAVQTAPGEATIWLAKDKGNGKAKGNANKEAKAKKQKGGNGQKAAKANGQKPGKDKPQQAAAKVKDDKPGKDKAKPQQAAAKAKEDKVAPGQAKKNDAAQKSAGKARARAEDVIKVKAPQGRDMAALLTAGAAALTLARPDLVIADVPDTELITYANCPPGLAKKNPPCVPPGLAKKGVTYEEWLTYDDADYDRVWVRERDDWLRDRTIPSDGSFLLDSGSIAALYGLSPAPSGQRYGLIDGLPVLLDNSDYDSLLLINQLAALTDLPGGVQIAPTAALTQEEMIRLYRLQQPQPGYNYSVLNGQLISLDDDAYQMLQMIRIARAIL